MRKIQICVGSLFGWLWEFYTHIHTHTLLKSYNIPVLVGQCLRVPGKNRFQGRRADLSDAAWWMVMLRSPQYLQQFTRTADIHSQHRLRSSVTDSLFVPAVRLSIVGRQAFPVAGARTWNDLPWDVTSSPSLFTFKPLRLKCAYFVIRTRDYHTN